MCNACYLLYRVQVQVRPLGLPISEEQEKVSNQVHSVLNTCVYNVFKNGDILDENSIIV